MIQHVFLSYQWNNVLEKLRPDNFLEEVEIFHFGIVQSGFISCGLVRYSFKLVVTNAHKHIVVK